MSGNRPIYSLKNVSFSYGLEGKNVLEDVSLNVYPGDFVVVCGVSGCGKTTLLKHLKPAMFPKGKLAGSIEFDDAPICKMDEEEQALKIGYVFQNPDSGIVTDKVWHELAFGMEGLSFTKTEIRKRVAEMASYFGIRDIFHSNTNMLSGGQKQLVCLASVMILRPKVIILDEPVSQLDPISASEFIAMLGRINREFGTTIIISEHRLEELFELCNKVILINERRIAYDGDFLGFSKYLINYADCTVREMMTVPMQIFMKTGAKGNMPLSVAEGRKWLEKVDLSTVDSVKEPDVINCNNSDNSDNKKEKPIVRLSDVWFSYNRSKPGKNREYDFIENVDVIRSLYMDIYRGRIHAIVGENGAGKSTLLSILSGILLPDRGRIKGLSQYSVSLMPQRAELLFSENTVEKELMNICNSSDNSSDDKLNRVVEQCLLRDYMSYNPYDLSGGERQRLALAIVLMQDSDIILLDEPTKGMDAAYKNVLGSILKKLIREGKTVIVVSHDIEFCAKYTQICYMMFDGEITAGDSTKRFFLDNTFYTTAAVRMTRDIIDGCVTVDDVSGYRYCNENKTDYCDGYTEDSETEEKYDRENTEVEKVSEQNTEAENSGPDHSGKLLTILSIFIYLVIIPLTVYAGSVFLENRRFYFISLLVIVEAFIPFIYTYEKNRPAARRAAVIAVMSAIAVVSRVAFYMLPAIKPILAVVIISGAALGAFDGFMIGSLSILVSNILFGQGPWTPWQMIGMGLTGLVAGLVFFKNREHINIILLCIVGFLETVFIYGVSVNIGTVFTMTEYVKTDSILKTCIAGIPFDLILASTTVVVLALAAKPLIKKLNRIV